MSNERRYWVGVACHDHVKAGVAGGFAQLGHGKHSAVKSLRRNDIIAYYSPRRALSAGNPVQAFTAIGVVTSAESYESDMHIGSSRAFRVDVDFVDDAKLSPIRPLLDQLSFTKDRATKWGMAFRRSKTLATLSDIKIICGAMRVDFSELQL